LEHINNLVVPDGFSIETVVISDAKSLTSGYNRAMKLTDAKYKVYLHQDTFIMDRHFIDNVLKIFLTNPLIGMLGVAGAEYLPISCSWGRAKKQYGKVIEGRADGTRVLKAFEEVYDGFQVVKCVDGLIMVTQYDIPWREDIFDGWHFYDISQCLEFIRSGYQVCIPKQKEPWCIHDCGDLNMENYHKYRYLFLKEYGNDLFKLGCLIILMNYCKDFLRPFIKSIELRVKNHG